MSPKDDGNSRQKWGGHVISRFHPHVTWNKRMRCGTRRSRLSRTMTATSHLLLGSHPGQLDKTQPSRVLRHPDAKLLFASFHPLTASNVQLGAAHDGSSNPKRIVIETHPNGFSHWRFVPRTRLAEGVSDEGTWPRLVDFLGSVAFVSKRYNPLTCTFP